MAGLKVIASTREADLRKLPVNSLTLAVGDLIELTAGATNWAACTSSSNHFTRKAIVMEAVTTATSVLAQEVFGDELVEASSNAASNTAHNGDRMALTDSNTVNNSGSDVTGQAVAFLQLGTIGATSDNRIFGRILVGSGVDPDAA